MATPRFPSAPAACPPLTAARSASANAPTSGYRRVASFSMQRSTTESISAETGAIALGRGGGASTCKRSISTGSPEMNGYRPRSEEHTSELQSLAYLVCRLLLEKKKNHKLTHKPPSNRPPPVRPLT